MKIDGITVSPKVTSEIVAAACARRDTTLDDVGFCLVCGCEAHGIEPDARGYECEACGEAAVYGCEDLMLEFA
jgi:hypothetical protein